MRQQIGFLIVFSIVGLPFISGCASLSEESGTKNEYATIEGLVTERHPVEVAPVSFTAMVMPLVVKPMGVIASDVRDDVPKTFRASSHTLSASHSSAAATSPASHGSSD